MLSQNPNFVHISVPLSCYLDNTFITWHVSYSLSETPATPRLMCALQVGK